MTLGFSFCNRLRHAYDFEGLKVSIHKGFHENEKKHSVPSDFGKKGFNGNERLSKKHDVKFRCNGVDSESVSARVTSFSLQQTFPQEDPGLSDSSLESLRRGSGSTISWSQVFGHLFNDSQ